MKKVLIIGASLLQLPAIKKAKELGYYVGVVDYNPNAVGIPYADEFFNVSTIDIDGVTNVAKMFQPDGIMTLATDMPMRAIAKATESCGLNGISMDTAIKATDKGEMIKAFEEHGVEHPWYFIANTKMEFDNLKARVTYPCIMKPIDNAGSRGVVYVNNSVSLEKEYSYAANESRQGGIIIEEYLSGPEVSVEVMVVDNTPFVLQVTDKITTGAPHFVEMGHTQPSRLAYADIVKIRDLACRAVKAIGISNGPAHVEIKITENGPKMIELGARMGGDCITSHLVPLSTGIDMVKATIELACGKKPDIIPTIQKGSAIRFIETGCGVIDHYENLEAVRNISEVKEISLLRNPGDSVGTITNSVDRAGYVVAQAETADLAARICEEAIRQIKVVLK